MVEFTYVKKGLDALARAHRINTMSGHLGAAVIAGYFIAEEHLQLDDAVYQGITSELEGIIAGGSVFSPRKAIPPTVAEMFDPPPIGRAVPEAIDDIAAALDDNISRPIQSGHNVIFASIALRALKDHPDLATRPIVDGIRKLTEKFKGQTPGSGNYGKGKGRIDGRKIQLPETPAIQPYTTLEGMAEAVMDQLIAHASEERQGYGGLWHIINHGAALTELANYGYRDIALKGLKAHHQHMELWKTLPDISAEVENKAPAKHDPHTGDYWGDDLEHDRALLTHRVKTIYGFDKLLELVKDPAKRHTAVLRMRYLM